MTRPSARRILPADFDIVLIQKDSGFRPGDVLATPAPLPTGAEKVPNPAPCDRTDRRGKMSGRNDSPTPGREWRIL